LYLYRMKRRRFILLSLTAAGAAGLPFAGCSPHGAPEILSKLCDERTMLEIGREYLQEHPHESDRNTLKKLTRSADVRAEFRNGNIVVVKGWVLSITEARQCALLTF
ncbi:MAG TPA: hypothetical protein VEB42_01975, partial [Chitinophagaceae bacterium]|nr:hypothetical protein [Chitinophagaceae bacterium]